VAGILAYYGYEAGAAAQSPQTVNGILLAVSLFCSIPFLVAVAMLFLYKIDKAMESRLESELGGRRLQATAP
jgi:Na+/melibiose symporter-like transporter